LQINLDGKVALVTGAASGIGRAAALALHACGARVAGCDRDRAGVESLVRDTGGLALDADVLKQAEVEAAVARTEAELGPISILVTAAGVLQRPSPPGDLKQAEWDRVLNVNLRGTYIAAASAGARMAARGAGSIVTVSSVLGYSPGLLHAYGPAKAALISLTQSLAAEWAAAGIRVNGVAPGFTETPALSRAVNFGVLNGAALVAASPRGRLITAEEVAAVIVFLASDTASGINGVTVPVDGGYLAAAGMRGFGSGA
jgi:NAD(P)-dependent dehydrogenase (short-subunit alcohol dehydrogenase family)